LVSVILPNYNYAHFLNQRIQSILNQSFTDFELLILDDASNDDSLSVIEKYASDKRMRVIQNSENSGSILIEFFD
jgi:glycosyltransferase involved in cell wall biosynthesis